MATSKTKKTIASGAAKSAASLNPRASSIVKATALKKPEASVTALSKLIGKLNTGSKASGAFVEENGPSWVEWMGEHKKPGDERGMYERGTITATFNVLSKEGAAMLKEIKSKGRR